MVKDAGLVYRRSTVHAHPHAFKVEKPCIESRRFSATKEQRTRTMLKLVLFLLKSWVAKSKNVVTLWVPSAEVVRTTRSCARCGESGV